MRQNFIVDRIVPVYEVVSKQSSSQAVKQSSSQAVKQSSSQADCEYLL